MFESRNEWFAHELQNHRREWVCVSCLNSYTEKVKFAAHVQSEHGSVVSGSQLEALILQSEEPVDKIPASGCPLCDEWESNLLRSKQDSKMLLNNEEVFEPCGTLSQFRRHLGHHMEQLALFTLPALTNCYQNSLLQLNSIVELDENRIKMEGKSDGDEEEDAFISIGIDFGTT
jgi:hypothetical protein